MNGKPVAVLGLLLALTGAIFAYSEYEFQSSGVRPFATALAGTVVNEDLRQVVAQAEARRAHVIVAFERVPARAFSVRALSVRAEEIRSLAVGLSLVGFEPEYEEVLPLMGYAVGTVPIEKVEALAVRPEIRALSRNPFIYVRARGREDDPLGLWEVAEFHEAEALPAAENIAVCVIDSGGPNVPWIDNAITVRGGGPIAEYFHGALVARIIHEVAPEAKINSIKALAPDGTARLSTIVKAMEAAAVMEPKVDVVNLSIGTRPGLFSPLDEASEVLEREYGMEVVAAAGNTSGGGQLSPATSRATISVGAITARKEVADYSASVFDVAAIGNVGRNKGTSFASPIAAGLLARYMSGLDPTVLKRLDARATVRGTVEAEALPVLMGGKLKAAEPVEEPGMAEALFYPLMIFLSGLLCLVLGARLRGRR